MKDTDKVTLTLGQIKKLVAESRKQKLNEKEVDSDAEWAKANKRLNPVKREIAKKGKDLFDQFKEKFITTMRKDFVKNDLSFQSDAPEDAAAQLFDALANGANASNLASEMFLY